MFTRIVTGLMLLCSSPLVLAQVDTSSDSYKTGQYVGYAFIAILAILILRKILKKLSHNSEPSGQIVIRFSGGDALCERYITSLCSRSLTLPVPWLSPEPRQPQMQLNVSVRGL